MDAALSQDVLLDHFKNPRNRGAVPGAAPKSGVNPACGDKVSLTFDVREGRLADVKHEGAGCVVSQASASMLTQAVRARPIAESRALARAVRGWVAGGGPAPDLSAEGLEDLESLAGVRRHPARVKCACLAWDLFLEWEGNHAAH